MVSIVCDVNFILMSCGAHVQMATPCCSSAAAAAAAVATVATSNGDDWRTLDHSPGRCATYGISGHRRDGDVLSSPNNTAAQPLAPGAPQRKLQEVCPQLATELGDPSAPVCCTEQQLDTLQRQIQVGNPGRSCGGLISALPYMQDGSSCWPCQLFLFAALTKTKKLDCDRSSVRALHFPLDNCIQHLPFFSPDSLNIPGRLPCLQPQLQALLLPTNLLT